MPYEPPIFAPGNRLDLTTNLVIEHIVKRSSLGSEFYARRSCLTPDNKQSNEKAKELLSRDPPAIEPRKFRNALGHFATGVTVITTRGDDNNLVGVTANSFNSVSLDPPMVLWSLAKASRGLRYFLEADYFCVNVLAADQVSVSNHFASKGENKFLEVETEAGLGGAPMLLDCAARFQCKTAFTYEGGDHLIFVGKVAAFDESGKQGLVYHQGKYAVSDIHSVHVDDEEEEQAGGGFVDDYLDYLLSTAAHRLQARFQGVLDKTGRRNTEWRVLAVLSDGAGISFERILRRTLIDAQALRALLKDLEGDDLISSRVWDYEEEFFLTNRGQSTVVNLLAAAKSHEVDALGHCSADEARALKQILKKLIGSLEPKKN